ncbi:cytidine deaminase family protein [Rhodococcus sp. IEGM 1318]|uniref:cytidine deaminase family protein n=1 Tax=Rhodococcus sp. IEGM 1318 TaxID=3082226 RepID=UPI0039893B81
MSDQILRLANAAWQVRKNARLIGTTAVGCAVLSDSGAIWSGCNIEHQFRSHDIHAEVNAIGNMISGGEKRLRIVLIAAQRERFSPCGACLDWIFEFADPECRVIWQGQPGGPLNSKYVRELMPFYPK